MPSDRLQPTQPSRVRQWGLHFYRWGVFVLIIWMIRQQHEWHRAQLLGREQAVITVERVKRFFPKAARLAEWNPKHGGQTVDDADGRPLGYVVQTAPASDRIVGYSGPNNTLIAFDKNDNILGIEVLNSGDTPEHLDAVVKDEMFMQSFTGISWQEARKRRAVDGVSGATLTSLAIAEGIVHRLGGTPHSYRFPQSVSVDEVKRFLPEASRLAHCEGRPGVLEVTDAKGQRLGAAARTSPTTDELIGFQGPTDTLIAFDNQERVMGIAIRRSYETSEYVDWVREEEHFMTLFNGMSLDELASLDLFQAEVEGVSGATMTSLTIAESLVTTAEHLRDVESPPSRPRIAVGSRDVGTALVIAFALVLAFTSLRSSKSIRIAFQVVLIVYLGLLHGDMVSQTLVVGWAQSGIPWRFAPGLVLLVAAALLVPLLTRRQLYCHHLCPHGAAQQLLRNTLPYRVRLPRWLARCLRALPSLLLVWVLAVAMLHLPINLAAIEPFDAYLFRIAGLAIIVVAIAGLIASLLVPMAYCRFGCPTGAMLNYLRLRGRHDRLTSRDLAALAFVLIAIALRYF